MNRFLFGLLILLGCIVPSYAAWVVREFSRRPGEWSIGPMITGLLAVFIAFLELARGARRLPVLWVRRWNRYSLFSFFVVAALLLTLAAIAEWNLVDGIGRLIAIWTPILAYWFLANKSKGFRDQGGVNE